jgi:fucose permease
MLLPIIYLAFVSLGLPDGLLGASWPQMHVDLGAAVAMQGVISMIIAGGTIVSSLNTDRLIAKLGTGKLTLASVALTAIALFGFASSPTFVTTCLWAIPYGLGAGAVDAALNNFVATHYAARHMNWLHCSWGIGASAGPLVLGAVMLTSAGWRGGYLAIGLAQAVLVAVLVAALPLWKKARIAHEEGGATETRPVPKAELIRLPGAKYALVGFLCYCAIESSCGLWGSTFMVLDRGIDAATAATLVSLFYVGIALGRFVSGVLTLRMGGEALTRLGEALIAAGVVVLLVGQGMVPTAVGLLLIGLGCAPIYPQMIQLTPKRFGEGASQSMMGLQMACAYVGSTFFPPLTGLILDNIYAGALPWIVGCLVAVMAFCMMRVDRSTAVERS